MLSHVDLGSAHLELSIELESEPISGSVATHDGESRKFSGWIELVAAIEDARANRLPPAKTLGSLLGAKSQEV